MKYLAHIENKIESEIISIYDVIKGLNGENPCEWEERTYFSLWYSTPMIAKANTSKRKPHFAFKKGVAKMKIREEEKAPNINYPKKLFMI